ncbi:MAG TPA: AMP-binding protein [Thermoclostridium caenicola]|nr:AMP-binding protein [Thermoclostridium caenicola]
MGRLYKEFMIETFDEEGKVTHVSFKKDPNFNFGYDIVDRIARDNPDKLAMVWCNEAGEERFITFREMKEESDRTAAYFRSVGIRKGDAVMLILRRHYEFWYCIVALHKLGAIAIPATNQLMTKDIVYRVNAASIKAIVCTADGQISSLVDEAQKETETLKIKIMVRGKRDGWLSYEEGVRQAPPFIPPEGDERPKADEIMLMYFSSGTTGMPKMVAHNYYYPLAHIPTAVYWHNVDPDGLHFTVSETGWAKSVWGKLYGQWIAEAAIFTFDFERFNADEMLKKMSKYKVTTFCAPPTVYRFLIKEDLSKYDLSSLKYCTTAGEALNPEVFKRFKEQTGIELKEGFGQTETTLVLATTTWMEPRPGSMGKPSPAYSVDIVDENGNSVSPGEVGEIVLRIDKEKPTGLMLGYYRSPEMTERAMRDGLYHTGDTAWRDEDGYYWYVGRTDDIIKSSGYRIGPFEVESVIMEHPAVLECAVTGVPDPLRGQVVKATIVLARGYQPSDALAKEIQEYVKEHTAPYKYPRVIEFVEELPKTISGKIRRVEIRQRDQAQ